MFFIFFWHLGLLAHPLTGYGCPGRGPQHGIEMSPVGISEFCHAIPCKSHFSTAQLGERLKNSVFVWRYQQNVMFYVMFDHGWSSSSPYFPMKKWTLNWGFFILHRKKHRLHTWARSRAGRTVLNLAQRYQRLGLRGLQLNGDFHGKIYGKIIYRWDLYMGKYMRKSSIYGIS